MKAILSLIFLILAASISSVAQNRGEALIKSATIMTAVRGTLEGTDILIRDGKIARIGKGLSAGAGARVIDGAGEIAVTMPDLALLDACTVARVPNGRMNMPRSTAITPPIKHLTKSFACLPVPA